MIICKKPVSRIMKYEIEKRDKDILRMLHEQTEQGMRMLFDSYYMQLCVYVVQLTDSFQVAEDVVQDFFVSFWEKEYYRQVNDNLRSYLYTSVHNAALAVLKRRKLVSLEELTGIPVEVPQDIICEKEELENKEQELMRRLEQLPPQELTAIRMVILENRKCVEVAESLHISVNTLKTHLARALRKLRKEYNLSLLFYSF